MTKLIEQRPMYAIKITRANGISYFQEDYMHTSQAALEEEIGYQKRASLLK